jgi:hypothetical protein
MAASKLHSLTTLVLGVGLMTGVGAAHAQRADQCSDPRVWPGMIAGLNRQGSLHKTVVAIRTMSAPNGMDPGSNPGPTGLVCHATIEFSDGNTDSGIVRAYDPGGNRPLQMSWKSESLVK